MEGTWFPNDTVTSYSKKVVYSTIWKKTQSN